MFVVLERCWQALWCWCWHRVDNEIINTQDFIYVGSKAYAGDIVRVRFINFMAQSSMEIAFHSGRRSYWTYNGQLLPRERAVNMRLAAVVTAIDMNVF